MTPICGSVNLSYIADDGDLRERQLILHCWWQQSARASTNLTLLMTAICASVNIILHCWWRRSAQASTNLTLLMTAICASVNLSYIVDDGDLRERQLYLTLLMTAICASASMMENQTPMSWARSATGRRVSHTNFWASMRISSQLLRSANNGASGNAATKIVMKPNCNTRSQTISLKFFVA